MGVGTEGRGGTEMRTAEGVEVAAEGAVARAAEGMDVVVEGAAGTAAAGSSGGTAGAQGTGAALLDAVEVGPGRGPSGGVELAPGRGSSGGEGGPAHRAQEGEGEWELGEEQRVLAVLLGASQPFGQPLEATLARRNDQPRVFSKGLVGAVVYAAYPSAGKQCVWLMTATRALVDPATRDLAQRAVARGTYGVWFKGRGQLPDAQCVALDPEGKRAEGEAGVWRAAVAAWGARRAARARRWAAWDPEPLLPPTRRLLSEYREVAQRIAEEEAAAGSAGARSERSLDLRAAGIMLAVHLQRELHKGAGEGAPSALHRRAVGKAITTLLSEGAAPPKPQFYDVEAIVDKAGWKAKTRKESGFDEWEPLPAPKEGELRKVCAKRLGLAYLEAVGEGNVPEDSAIWTVLSECRGHTQALAPHLEEKLREAHERGEPLWLFDREALEPSPQGRELELFWAEIARLIKQGTLEELTEAQQKDPTQCAAVAYLGVTFKGVLSRSAEEDKAVQDGDLAAIARLAQQRAGKMMGELQAALGALAGAQGGASGGVAAAAAPAPQQRPAGARHAHVLLEQLLAKDAQSITKCRPVARFQYLSRGSEKLGIEPGGVLPSGCKPPQLLDVVAGATLADLIARCDAKDYFYCLNLSEKGRALSCLAVHDPSFPGGGRLRIFRLTALCMGQSSSPSMAQVVSSTVALIANARGAATATCPGWKALCDDFLCVASREELQHAVNILVKLMDEVGVTEAAQKRVFASQAELMGKEFDLERGTVRVPPGRLHKYLYHLHLALAALGHEDPVVQAAISVDFLTRLTGVLGWVSETLVSGTLHLNALYACTSGRKSIAQCRERVVADLRWWAAQAAAGKLESTLRLDGKVTTHSVTLDASDVAIAAVSSDSAEWRPLTQHERTMSSTRRELRAMALAVEMEGRRHPGSTLVLCSDSLPAVCSFNKGRARGKGRRDLLAVYEALERHGCHAVALWLPREFNRVADGASKAATEQAFGAWAEARGMTVE